MIRHNLLCGGLFALLVSAQLWANPPTPQITLYTIQSYPIAFEPADNIKHYTLDSAMQLEDQFTQHFSDDPDEAEQQAYALFNSAGWAAQESQLKQAYEGVISGWQNGIKKVPAILFQTDGMPDAVIYGMTDLNQAILYWQAWLKR